MSQKQSGEAIAQKFTDIVNGLNDRIKEKVSRIIPDKQTAEVTAVGMMAVVCRMFEVLKNDPIYKMTMLAVGCSDDELLQPKLDMLVFECCLEATKDLFAEFEKLVALSNEGTDAALQYLRSNRTL